jgi:hypothetical protein
VASWAERPVKRVPVTRLPAERNVPLGRVPLGSIVRVNGEWGVAEAYNGNTRHRYIQFWDGPPAIARLTERVDVASRLVFPGAQR